MPIFLIKKLLKILLIIWIMCAKQYNKEIWEKRKKNYPLMHSVADLHHT